MPDAILLAVAVHDEGEARLERAVPQRIHVEAGRMLHFRISYRLAAHALSREDARLEGLVRIGTRPPQVAHVEMHTRPLLNNARQGDLEFDVPPLPAGTHTLRFRVHLETSDQELLWQQPHDQTADVDGTVDVEAA